MRITVKVKLAAAFSVVILLSALAAVIAINGLGELNGKIDELVSHSATGQEYALKLETDALDVIRADKNMLLADTLEGRTRYQKETVGLSEVFRADAVKLSNVSGDAQKQKIAAATKAFDRMNLIFDKEWDLAKQMSNAQAFEVSKKEGVPAAAAKRPTEFNTPACSDVSEMNSK